MRWIKITILTILTISAATLNADTLRQASTETGNRLTTADAAVARALAYTGFDRSSSFSRETVNISTHMVTFKDSMVPYEYDWETGREAWLITFEDIILDFPDERLRTTEYARDFDVIIDAETGQLLRVISPCKDQRTSDFLSEVPENSVYPNIGVKVSLPGRLPNTSLNNVLHTNPEVLGTEYTTSAAEAKQIVAYYLNYAWIGHGPRVTLVEGEPRDYWMIILKDTNLNPALADGEVSAVRIFGQSFFDAISGKSVPTPYMLVRYPDGYIDRHAPR